MTEVDGDKRRLVDLIHLYELARLANANQLLEDNTDVFVKTLKRRIDECDRELRYLRRELEQMLVPSQTQTNNQ